MVKQYHLSGYDISYFVATLVSIFLYVTGGLDKLFWACTIFIAFDIFTGYLSARYTNEFKSRIMYWGLVRKMVMSAFMVIGHQLDLVVTNGTSHFVRNAVLMYIMAMEGLSIIENINKLELKAPDFMTQMLERMKQKHDKGEKEEHPIHPEQKKH